ncbi:MAG: primase traC (modular protein) [Acidobacteria bacterium]|nr:primase traC (modular protein) [Acidobacteriota bacterium]
MLSQNFIPTRTRQATELVSGTHELIAELHERLRAGESFDNPKLTEIADKSFGGTRAQGKYTSRDAYDALEIAVNKYLDSQALTLMQMDAADALASVLRPLTKRLARQCDRTLEQTELQQFSTPPPLAYLAARILNPQSNDIVLEPSAGTGSLAIWPRSIGAQIICNEINPRRRALLTQELSFATHQLDAEIVDDLLPAQIQPTAILMNPPFSATGGRVAKHSAHYGARHIESALRRLKQGGRLVAIAGEGMSFHRAAFSEWWQRIASAYNVRANLHLSGKEYGKYGTTFDLQILVIDKTGQTTGNDWQEQLNSIVWRDAETIEDAWTALSGIADRPDAPTDQNGDSETTEEASQTLFVSYAPAKLKGGRPHPAIIVESSSMAAVVSPDITYRPHLAAEIVSEGRLSDIQIERVIYAGQRHEQQLPDSSRAGFFVGDGTGVGKGRILAGIIADNFNQGRERALWLSVNNDLIEATRRDLTDLGLESIPLARINDYPAAGEITLPRGVIFSSYSSLIAAAKTGERRIDQIQKWLGTDAVVIFDEAHKAKNALAGGRGEPTLTGQAVIDLQDPERNPDYRVVYSSATGATDVRNMAYMTRLGLWGVGTSFPGGFQEFMQEIESGGVGAMEMVSRDMKALGMYLSGSISFGLCPESGKSVEYRERIHRLTPQQREMYNQAAAAWQAVLRDIDAALVVTNGGSRARAIALNKFWGDHQRFFRQVICAFKVPSVIAETEGALSDGKSIVISLVGTGEARTREQVARATAAGGTLEDLDFSPREVIAAMVDRAFPTTLYQDATDPATGKTIQVPVKDHQGNIVQSKQALQMKQDLIDGLSALELPQNPLDQLVNHFGERNVAELTGRTRRLIRDVRSGQVQYKKRAPEGVAMDRTNVYEMEQFQSGKKRIAIISDAASTGISLHASNRDENRQRRVHITLELGWSADKQMQTFGRTHRSDQAVPPEYVLLSTELGGEKRFSSTIARRLGSLGALTKGDRGAADNGDLGKYNFETEEGKAALSLVLRRIMKGEDVPGLDNPRQTLRDIGLLVRNRDGAEDIRKEDEYNVPRFLNRVLALDVQQQNALFDHFADLFDQTLRYAKANGTFDEGVTDIKGLAVRLAKPPRTIHTDQITGAQTTHYTLEIDLPSKAVSFEEAERTRQRKGGAFLRHRKNGHFILAIESGRHTDPASGSSYRTFAIWRPEAARSTYTRDSELSEKYKAVTPEKARVWWTEKHATVPAIETIETHIIGGAIIPLWQRLKTHEDTRLRVVRVSTDDAQRIVGIQIPQDRVGVVLRTIGSERDLREPDEILNRILDEGEEITLVSNLTLRRGLIHREPAVELCGADPYKFAELRELGLINEQISWKQRFFIPTDETTGTEILSALLDRYPVVVAEEEANEIEANLAEIGTQRQMTPTNVVDLDQWIIAAGESNARTVNEVDPQIEGGLLALETAAAPEEVPPHELEQATISSLTQQSAAMPWLGQATSTTQLAFEFA